MIQKTVSKHIIVTQHEEIDEYGVTQFCETCEKKQLIKFRLRKLTEDMSEWNKILQINPTGNQVRQPTETIKKRNWIRAITRDRDNIMDAQPKARNSCFL